MDRADCVVSVFGLSDMKDCGSLAGASLHMLVIRNVQMVAFQAAVWRKVYGQIADAMLTLRPAAGETDEALLHFVEQEAARARSYGLLTPGEQASFVIAAWLMGSGFDLREPARSALRSSGVSEQKRLFLDRACETAQQSVRES